MKKRILSILLVLVMVFTMLPLSTVEAKEVNVTGILNDTMVQLVADIPKPSFGTTAGEWTVFSLARGEYYAKDSTYFVEYYNRIVETVNETASKVSLKNGALHAKKSTDNARLIVALSAIGKDATKVGNWNLITPYDDFGWIKNQGLNGVIWALIALDTKDYQTTDTTIRQQCVDYILEKQLSDGGWALAGKVADPDVTAMALQALYTYKDQTDVGNAAKKAFTCLSSIQNDDGGYSSFGDANSESCAQVIVAATTWGVNPHMDAGFVKNGKSVLDALVEHYVEEKAAFKHVVSGDVNAIATDQACYALIAYHRFLNNKTSLYDMSDVTFETDVEIKENAPIATLGHPSQISGTKGESFKVTINLDRWNNEGKYKLIDAVINIPAGLKVTNVTAGERLNGGTVNYNQEETGKLRIVYFDVNEHRDLTVSGTEYPAQFFTITLTVEDLGLSDKVAIDMGGMSIKLSSDSMNEDAMIVVDTTKASGEMEVVKGISYSTMCLYTGDGIDLIPSTKKAVAVSTVGMESIGNFVYMDGTNEYEFKYSGELSEGLGNPTYVAFVDADVEMAQFEKVSNINVEIAEEKDVNKIMFGDSNNDEVVNAQDALAAVDAWLRKTEEPSDDEILALNVNGDSRINTFDALGIVEAFVDGIEYMIITNAAL